MNWTLKRREYRDDGIFSDLLDEQGNLIAVTLEHSYNRLPKIPAGVFRCVRSEHQLHGMTEKFVTFEITGVPFHTGLLFHWGCYNRDSEGCVLVGAHESGNMIIRSRDTFAKLMGLQTGVNTFQLTVIA